MEGRERVDMLSSYVPQAVLRQLANASPTQTDEHAARFQAALLLVDIRGFTALTASMVRRGPAGTEQLSRTLNAYLDEIIRLASDHGGDITKILGDAVLPIWPAEHDDITTATRRAVLCGLAITARLSELQVADDVRLSLRVGVGVGSIVAAQVGGVDGHKLFLIAGEAIAQLTPLEAHMETGGVVVSPPAWSLVSHAFVGHSLAHGHVSVVMAKQDLQPRPLIPVTLPLEGERSLRDYIPVVCLSRLDAGQADWLGELRPTTVLFASVQGVADATPDAVHRLQEMTVAAQRVLARYDGWLKETTMDDKGTTLVAAFGVPPLTHEDDPVRAVHAALDVQAEIRRVGLRARVGVATGLAFCGPVGNGQRRDFAVLGQHVILASRLAQSSHEEAVLCDASTYEGARGRLTFEQLPAYVLKGMPSPVDVYRVRSDATHQAHSVIVDRSNELAAVSQALERLTAGTGALFLVEGEPGIGKSRLVAELARRARALGVRCAIGTAQAVESATPYHAWSGAFERLFGLEVVTDAEARRGLVLSKLGADRARLAPLLNPVLALDLHDTEITAQMTGAVRADNTRDLLVDLLAREVVPLMVVLEDGHWFDSASWTLALRAHREVPSLLLVITMRPMAEAVPDDLNSIRAEATMLELGALSPSDTLALACTRTGAGDLAEPVAAIVNGRAEGNPLFIEHLIYAMRDGGQIVVDNGLCRAANASGELKGLIIPDTVQRVITSRIDQLPAAEAMTLKVASVIGGRFTLRTLREIYPLDEQGDVLVDHLAALTRVDLISPDRVAPEATYYFRHVITQEVAYGLMLPAQARELHRSLAEWHERIYASDLTPFHAFLAHHWGKAGLATKAVDYLELAGTAALHSFANQEAIGFFEQAAALDREAKLGVEGSRRGRWELQMGMAYVNLSRYREGQIHLEAGLRLLGRRPPASRSEQVLWLAGQLFQQLLRRVGLRRVTKRFSEAEIAALRAYGNLAEVAYYAGEQVLPLYCVLYTLNESEVTGLPAEIARGFAGSGALLGVVPLHRVARWYLRRALEALEKVDDLTDHEIVEIVVGFYYIGVGKWEYARERFKKVEEIARRLGDRRRLDDALVNLLELEFLRGAFRAGVELADQLYPSAGARNDRRFQGEALAGKAYCLLRLGNAGEAMKCLAALRAMAIDAPEVTVDLKIKLAGLLAVTHLSRGELEQALAASDEAMRLVPRRPTYFGLFAGYIGPTEVYLKLCEADPTAPHARARAHEALGLLKRYASVFPIGEPRYWALQGSYDWLRGRHGQARKAWRRSLAAAEALSMEYEVGVAHYEIGRHLEPDDAARATHLAQAREIFLRLNAAPALAGADEVTPPSA